MFLTKNTRKVFLQMGIHDTSMMSHIVVFCISFISAKGRDTLIGQLFPQEMFDSVSYCISYFDVFYHEIHFYGLGAF